MRKWNMQSKGSFDMDGEHINPDAPSPVVSQPHKVDDDALVGDLSDRNEREELPLSVAASQPIAAHGGIPAFASGGASVNPSDGKRVEMTDTQALVVHFETEEPAGDVDKSIKDPPSPVAPELVSCKLIRVGEEQGVDIFASKGTTVGSITVAEDKLGTFSQPIRLTNILGVPIPAASQLGEDCLVYMNMHSDSMGRPMQLGNHHPFAHNVMPVSKLTMLQHQGPWVSASEMQFYLKMFEHTTGCVTIPVEVFHDWTLEEELTQQLFEWGNAIHEALKSTNRVASVLLIGGHWMPVILQSHAMGTRAMTTPEGLDWMKIALDKWGFQTQFVQVMLPQVHSLRYALPMAFACGFQSVGWLFANHVAQLDASQVHTTGAIQEQLAVEWRSLYRASILNDGTWQEQVIPAQCKLGGTNQGELSDTLRQMLESHGVPTESSRSRAQTVIEKLGRAAVLQATRCPRPWRELKALAK